MLTGEDGDAHVAAAIAHGDEFVVHRQYGAVFAFVAVLVGFEPAAECVGIGVELAGVLALGVGRLHRASVMLEPATNGITGESGTADDFS